MTDLVALAKFIRDIPSKMGGIHFLINAAGILGPDYDVPLDQLPPEAWALVSQPSCSSRAYYSVFLDGNQADTNCELSGARRESPRARNYHARGDPADAPAGPAAVSTREEGRPSGRDLHPARGHH